LALYEGWIYETQKYHHSLFRITVFDKFGFRSSSKHIKYLGRESVWKLFIIIFVRVITCCWNLNVHQNSERGSYDNRWFTDFGLGKFGTFPEMDISDCDYFHWVVYWNILAKDVL
jgi:hypothetical protein